MAALSLRAGQIRWTVDYVSAGSRLLAAVRPAAGTLYELAVTKGGTGSGQVRAGDGALDCGPDCRARYLQGAAVTLTALADPGSTFTEWSDGCRGTASTITVTIAVAKTCTASFTRTFHTLTVQKNGDGASESWVTSVPSGIACGSTCAAPFGVGATVALTVDAAAGYEFVGWEGAGCGDDDRGADVHGALPGAAGDVRSRQVPAG